MLLFLSTAVALFLLSCNPYGLLYSLPIDFSSPLYNDNYNIIIKIPLTFNFYDTNPPNIKHYEFQLDYLQDDPVDSIVSFCKLHNLQLSNCNVIVNELKKQLLKLQLFFNENNILYVRDYYYNQAIIYNNESIISRSSNSSSSSSRINDQYYDTIHIDLYYINFQSTCISVTKAYLPHFNNDNNKHHQHGNIEKICTYHNLETIHCELLYWKLYIKYDLNMYKSLTVNDYLDVIMPSLTHSGFRIPLPPKFNSNIYDKNVHSLEISNLCKQSQFNRKSCTLFMKNIRDGLNRHYGSSNPYADNLYDTIYVMDTIEEILIQRGNSKYSDHDDHDDNRFIDVDVVEIGTSNFDTIIGLIDKDDQISGTMIQPCYSCR